jgi:hypothetical protein
MSMPGRRVLVCALHCAALTAGTIALAGAAAAQGCAPGFVPNPYTAQCLAPVSTPIIAGVPCVPSNLGLCQSLVQNLPVPRPPSAAG